jgi:GMC oxidoreductase
MALLTERTTFTLDVPGRYTANTWQEVLDSQDQTLDAHARPFDVFILGGGTFGPAIASRLFTNDHTRARRILLIEAGPLALPEHVQNLPSLGTDEVWGVPWNSDSPQPQDRIFPGLAFCLGGRSVFWGGWSPHFLPEEIPTPPWLTSVRDDLLNPVLTIPDAGGVRTLSYLDLAAEQIGAHDTNDFISGALHNAMRDRLFAGLTGRPAGATTLTGSRGTLANQGQLEAPLAVESTSPRPGFLPFNKFSVVPLLVRVSRLAQDESVLPNNLRKRFMVLDNTHVIGLDIAGDRITRIRTSRGNLDVPANGLVFLGLGTIENTRMALNTLDRARGYDPNQLIGRNLMAHMRSNLTFRVPRSALGQMLDVNLHPETRELQVSALFIKGIHDLGAGDTGYFHVQVTASGVGEMGRNSELELFKKVPDIDLLHRFQGLTDAWVVVTLRGIGEIRGDRTAATPNRVTTGGPQGPFDFGMPRALVRLDVGPAGSRQRRLWDAMDAACDELAQLFAAGGPIQYLSDQTPGAVWQTSPPGPDQRRDALSSTHHEAGTLWMGDDPATSVTDELGRFHEVRNLFALGPCLLPTMGSPNPVLSGLALARRTADRVPLATAAPPAVEAGFTPLFDGTDTTFARWQPVGGGSFSLVDGMIVAQPGPELGAAVLFGGQLRRLRAPPRRSHPQRRRELRDLRALPQPAAAGPRPRQPGQQLRVRQQGLRRGRHRLRGAAGRPGPRRPSPRHPRRAGPAPNRRHLRHPHRSGRRPADLHQAATTDAADLACAGDPGRWRPVHRQPGRQPDQHLHQHQPSARPARYPRPQHRLCRRPVAHRAGCLPQHPRATAPVGLALLVMSACPCAAERRTTQVRRATAVAETVDSATTTRAAW